MHGVFLVTYLTYYSHSPLAYSYSWCHILPTLLTPIWEFHTLHDCGMWLYKWNQHLRRMLSDTLLHMYIRTSMTMTDANFCNIHLSIVVTPPNPSGILYREPLYNPDTLGIIISGVHFMEVSWFHLGVVITCKCSIWDHNKCLDSEYGSVLATVQLLLISIW